MRAIPPALQTKLDTGATTLCRCWIVTRNDGVTQGFTDHDENVVVDGVTCLAAAGLNAAEATQKLGLAVTGSDLSGALADDSLTEADLAAGRYDAAEVAIWLVDWSEPELAVLLAKGVLGEVPTFFTVERFSVNVERRYNAIGELVTVAEAIVKVEVDGEILISAAEGNGPVNALDLALRKDLGKYQRFIEGIRLIDFKVRVFQGGTDAVTRVLIESGDETGARWSTVGVSPNIIDASFQALSDSIIYKLVTSGA